MAKLDSVQIDESEVWRNVVVTVKVKRQPFTWVRVWLAMFFMRIAAKVAPFDVNFEQE